MTKHPIIEAAEAVIERAAQLCEQKWHRRSDGSKAYGTPEALAEAAGEDRVARVVAERQCVTGGVDVWWNDLICEDGDDAAEALRDLGAIDASLFYGEKWEANLGLLILTADLTADHFNGLANVTGTAQWRAYNECIDLARGMDRELLLIHLTEDIHFCAAWQATTPAGVERRLRGIRALECVAAHHVLFDVLPAQMRHTLVQPVAKLLLPLHLTR